MNKKFSWLLKKKVLFCLIQGVFRILRLGNDDTDGMWCTHASHYRQTHSAPSVAAEPRRVWYSDSMSFLSSTFWYFFSPIYNRCVAQTIGFLRSVRLSTSTDGTTSKNAVKSPSLLPTVYRRRHRSDSPSAPVPTTGRIGRLSRTPCLIRRGQGRSVNTQRERRLTLVWQVLLKTKTAVSSSPKGRIVRGKTRHASSRHRPWQVWRAARRRRAWPRPRRCWSSCSRKSTSRERRSSGRCSRMVRMAGCGMVGMFVLLGDDRVCICKRAAGRAVTRVRMSARPI